MPRQSVRQDLVMGNVRRSACQRDPMMKDFNLTVDDQPLNMVSTKQAHSCGRRGLLRLL